MRAGLHPGVRGGGLSQRKAGVHHRPQPPAFDIGPDDTLQFIGDVEYLKTWLSATGTGAEPTSLPLKTIVGPAAAANSDGWKLGTNAT